LLGRPFEIEGRVLTGDKRGREIGFPTMNIELGEYIRPALGVYAVRAAIEGDDGAEWRDGVANLGRRPTVDGTRLLLEVHLFDFDREVYGRRVRVALIEYIRSERRFPGLDDLKAQITEDWATAKRILKTRAAGAT
jgi:riboflavin kinase/FMN adenylyltransferase